MAHVDRSSARGDLGKACRRRKASKSYLVGCTCPCIQTVFLGDLRRLGWRLGAYTKLIAHALGQNPLGSPTDRAGPLVQAIRAWPVHVMGLVAQLQQSAQSASYSVIAWCAHSV